MYGPAKISKQPNKSMIKLLYIYRVAFKLHSVYLVLLESIKNFLSDYYILNMYVKFHVKLFDP